MKRWEKLKTWVWVLGCWIRSRVRGFWRRSYRFGRWLFNHLVQILALAALPFLIIELVRSLRPGTSAFGRAPALGSVPPSSQGAQGAQGALGAELTHLSVLLALILLAAVLTQVRGSLFSRLKKVGPVEFVEERYAALVPELDKLPNRFHLDGSKQRLSQEVLLEYRKADRYLTHLEWSEPEDKMPRTDRFYDLLFKMSAIALMKREWVYAADRLELLLRISDGKFRPGVTHLRCGHAYYRYWTETRKGNTPHEKDHRENLIWKAAEHYRKAVKEDPFRAEAYFWLAFVQVDLKMIDHAIENNKKAIRCRSDSAGAKYNLAVCHVLREDYDAAIASLRLIEPDDDDRRRVIADSHEDEEIAPLLRDQKHGAEARRILERPD